MSNETDTPVRKPKKSVALSGVAAGNTALCSVGLSGNDLAYCGYDILDFAEKAEFEEIAHLLIHGRLPNQAELVNYKRKLRALRGLPLVVKEVLESKNIVHTINRIGSMISVHFSESEVVDFDTAAKGNNDTFKKFFHGLLNEGIYIAPSAFETWFITDALSYEDLDYTIEAIDKVAKTL